MIRRRVDHRDPIEPRVQTPGHLARQSTIHRGGVQALEVREGFRVRRRRLIEPSQLLNHNMRMSYNIPTRVYLLGAGHVSLLWIREPARFEMTDRDLNGERLVHGERLKVCGKDKFGRGHVVHTWNDTDWGRIT